MKRYRYIVASGTKIEDCIKYQQLFSTRVEDACIRVEIPDDMELEKYSSDSYSLTMDERLIKDLNPCAMIYENGKWIICNKLLKYPIYEWHKHK